MCEQFILYLPYLLEMNQHNLQNIDERIVLQYLLL